MRKMSRRSEVFLCDDHHHWVKSGYTTRKCPECRKVKT